MRGSTALLRAATAVAMSAALMLPFNTGAAAIGTTGLDLNKLRPELRNHVSGMVDQAISSRSSSGSSAILVNFFPRQDECNITRAGNVKVNQNCLVVRMLTCKAAARPKTRQRLPSIQQPASHRHGLQRLSKG